MASSDPTPRRFDIVVVPFPYAGRLAEKRRPALVVSTDSFNRKHGLLWVVMITSAANPRRDGDIPVAATARTGLPVPSAIRAAKIATIEPGRVVRVAGRIDAKTAAQSASNCWRSWVREENPATAKETDKCALQSSSKEPATAIRPTCRTYPDVSPRVPPSAMSRLKSATLSGFISTA